MEAGFKYYFSVLLGNLEDPGSSIILKDDDGCDIKLRLLRNPIPLNSIICEDESPIKDTKDIASKDKKIFSNPLKTLSKETEVKTITFLKEPISLDRLDLEGISSLTLNVKTVERTIHKRPIKTRTEAHEHWMNTAAIIFEMTHVYPFIYINNKYKCFVCSQSFVESNILQQHTTSHNNTEIRQKIYNTPANSMIKIDITHLQCRVCHKTFQSLPELKSHLNKHGKDIESDSQDNLISFRLGCEPFQCQACGEEYHKLRPLVIHMNKHYNNFSCEVCGSVFISKQSLNHHLKTHESGTFPCEICDKVFSSSAKKSLHMRGVHLKRFPRKCPMCSERFNSHYQRTKHLRFVHNKIAGVNRCVACGKEFHLKYQLQLHIRSVHYQEKDQECPVCQARFFSKNMLSRHMLIHTGIRNFKCAVCGKAYVRKSHLKQHSRSHVVE